MKYQDVLAAACSPLCYWYRENQRILPWRENREPYRIWVSEIMLQQTRVEAAIPYFHRFLEALPTVRHLAMAELPQLLKLWEGLGYYSRVKNMQKAAQVIVEKYEGSFPKDVKRLRALPGIGEYTAGAVASIAFNLPEPAVDGNVMRVVARLLNDDADILQPQTKKRVHAMLQKIYPLSEDCGELTQALMELGALVCIPGSTPKCENCPLASLCQAKAQGREHLLPVRTAKNEKKIIKRTMFLLCCQNQVALVKRPEQGLLAGLWEFPSAEGHLNHLQAKAWIFQGNFRGTLLPGECCRHVFTHLIWDMKSYYVEVDDKYEDFFWFSMEELAQTVPLPSAMRPFYMFLKKRMEKGL